MQTCSAQSGKSGNSLDSLVPPSGCTTKKSLNSAVMQREDASLPLSLPRPCMTRRGAVLTGCLSALLGGLAAQQPQNGPAQNSHACLASVAVAPVGLPATEAKRAALASRCVLDLGLLHPQHNSDLQPGSRVCKGTKLAWSSMTSGRSVVASLVSAVLFCRHWALRQTAGRQAARPQSCCLPFPGEQAAT